MLHTGIPLYLVLQVSAQCHTRLGQNVSMPHTPGDKSRPYLHAIPIISMACSRGTSLFFFLCLIVLHNRVAYLMSVESYPLGQVITQQGVAPVSSWHLSDISTHAHSDLIQLLLGQRRFCSINCVRK